MQIESHHPDYDAHASAWARAREVLAGEDAIKAAGERYLPRLDSQTDDEYAAYRTRASFFGATARTLEDFLSLIFRRTPTLQLPDTDAMRRFAADCDLCGTDFPTYARRIVSEVLSVGRAGSLVLPAATLDAQVPRPQRSDVPTNRETLDFPVPPYVSLWLAEDILNWTVAPHGQPAVLTELVLRDRSSTPHRLVALRLVNGGCIRETWSQTAGQWQLADRQTLSREAEPLPFIPFVFHGPEHSRPDPGKLPLADLIAANLDHYRLDADYKHGLHFAALPTAWVSGFDKSAPLRIGSSTAWVSEIPGASAGFLEFHGAGLANIERAIEKVERRMALLGVRLLHEPQSPTLNLSSAPSAVTHQASTTQSGLGSMVSTLNQSLSGVLRLGQWWTAGPAAADAPQPAAFTMNTDLATPQMRGEDLSAVVAAWRAGAISRDTMLDFLKRGEILPDGRSVAQEQALIHRSSPHSNATSCS